MGLCRKEKVKVSELESKSTGGSAEVGTEYVYMGMSVILSSGYKQVIQVISRS